MVAALPFPDGRFALAVSGFLLFAYPDVLDVDRHRDASLELVRVTRGEVRVLPLPGPAGVPSPHADLRDAGVRTGLRVAGCSHAPCRGSDLMPRVHRRHTRRRRTGSRNGTCIVVAAPVSRRLCGPRNAGVEATMLVPPD